MVDSHGQNDPNQTPNPSPRLRDDLTKLYDPGAEIPPLVDQAILAGIHLTFIMERRKKRLLRVVAVGAAAASIALLVCLAVTWERPARPAKMAAATRPATSHQAQPSPDVDHNGRVDIRDAFLIARGIAAGTAPPRAYDVNGDGKIDRADVDAVAMSAVKLDAGSIQ